MWDIIKQLQQRLQPTQPAKPAQQVIAPYSMAQTFQTLKPSLSITQPMGPKVTIPQVTQPPSPPLISATTPSVMGGGYTTDTISSLLEKLATPSPAYEQAQKAYEAQIPLIQQRYKSLLDELTLKTQRETQEAGKAREAQIGETRARAGALGTFGGTTELGTEDLIRQKAVETIRGIEEQAASQGRTLTAQEASDIASIKSNIAGIGMKAAEAERAGTKDLLSYLIDLEKMAQKERTSGTDITSLFQNQGQIESYGITLQDPETGQFYQYDSMDDPDYLEDLQKGYQPVWERIG